MNEKILKIYKHKINNDISDMKISEEIGISRQTFWYLTSGKEKKYHEDTMDKIDQFIEKEGL